MILTVNAAAPYDIHLGRGMLKRAGEIIDLNGRKALIVTDSGVPVRHVDALKSAINRNDVFVFEQGEQSKNFDSLQAILKTLLELNFGRRDVVVAFGGGVAGDMAGFAASCFMRGIDFYNIPTTLLAQVDSSIGGKTAIDFCGIKNCVGAFYLPKAVIIDPDVLTTLDGRQLSNGLAEAIKMGITGDRELFELCRSGKAQEHIEEIILRCLKYKSAVVEQDERESGLRRVLNFGHTVGHGIEAASGGQLLHGESVGLGMLPMCGEKLRPQALEALERCNLPTSFDYDAEKVFAALTHDKKGGGGQITLVKSDEAGSFYFSNEEIQSLKKYL